MDRAPLQEIDVHDGLENTLTILSYKLKSADIDLIREYDEGLPPVKAYGSKLNQVWTNLIDNAIDASGYAHLRSKAGCSWKSPTTAKAFPKRCSSTFSNPFSQPRMSERAPVLVWTSPAA
jgi:hypothetical protein